MKIAYIARHMQANSADDEGAVAHALRELGHEVRCVPESRGHRAVELRPDLLLFHKWGDTAALRAARCPKVFWYFDLVEWPGDSSLLGRDRSRREWMAQVLPLADLGFCTDGDWAKRHPDKLVWLPQGADGRIAGRGNPLSGDAVPLLFTGIAARGGRERASFVEGLRARYGGSFRHVPSGVYREALKELIARTAVVVAPDSPVTDKYASNRVWNALGFGAFLLHPDVAFVREAYRDGEHLRLYRDRDHLYELIDHYLERPAERRSIAAQGLLRTQNSHLYRHRVETLLAVVQERLGVG